MKTYRITIGCLVELVPENDDAPDWDDHELSIDVVAENTSDAARRLAEAWSGLTKGLAR